MTMLVALINTPIAIGVRVSPAPWSDALPAYVSDQNGMPTAAAFKYTVPWCRASGSAPSSFSQELPRNHITTPTSTPHANAIRIALGSVRDASSGRFAPTLRAITAVEPTARAIMPACENQKIWPARRTPARESSPRWPTNAVSTSCTIEKLTCCTTTGQASRMTERMRCSSSIVPGGAAIASAASADMLRLEPGTGTYASHYGKRVAAIDTGTRAPFTTFVRKTQRLDTQDASFIMNPYSGGVLAVRQNARRNPAYSEDVFALPFPRDAEPHSGVRDDTRNRAATPSAALGADTGASR